MAPRPSAACGHRQSATAVPVAHRLRHRALRTSPAPFNARHSVLCRRPLAAVRRSTVLARARPSCSWRAIRFRNMIIAAETS